MSWKLSKKLKDCNLPASTDVSTFSPTEYSLPPRMLRGTDIQSGLLNVTIHGAQDILMPVEYSHRFGDVGKPSRSSSAQRHHMLYAIMDYDKAQVPVKLGQHDITQTPKHFHWDARPAITCSFRIRRGTQLNITLFMGALHPLPESQPMLLGTISIHPFSDLAKWAPQWVQMEYGTGRICLGLEYVPTEHTALNVADFWVLNKSPSVIKITEKGDDRKVRPSWVQKSIIQDEGVSLSKKACNITHPFIAPLAFTSGEKNKVRLFAPCMTGGHVFHHLQRVGRFEETTARFYAAELVCALDYLHDSLDTVFWLKSKNVLLDAQGHITVCSFDLFTRKDESEDRGPQKWPEYPPPELLIRKEVTVKDIEWLKTSYQTVNWWTLGILLYEMLTGLLPFHSEEPRTIRENILEQDIHLPASMSPYAKDILKNLLDRRPEERLGARGVAEITSHVFFADIEWQRLLQRNYTSMFPPEDVTTPYEPYGVNYPCGSALSYPEPLRDQLRRAGWSIPDSFEVLPPETGTLPGRSEATGKRNNEWRLVWLDVPEEFRFINQVTNEEAQIPSGHSSNPNTEHTHDPSNPNTPSPPTKTQKLSALQAAMTNGYDTAISDLLSHGLDLNTHFYFHSSYRTPLECAIMRNKPDLVLTCLSRSTLPIHPSALTQALALAAEQQNVPIVTTLLAHGASCNFGDSDPRSTHTRPECQIGDGGLDYTPPLVRAVQCGNVEIARLLVAHGADINAEYHDLKPGHDQEIYFTCGKVVQLAAEVGPLDMACFLVESGADVEVAERCVCRYRECGFVKREVYQRVVGRLREMKRKESVIK